MCLRKAERQRLESGYYAEGSHVLQTGEDSQATKDGILGCSLADAPLTVTVSKLLIEEYNKDVELEAGITAFAKKEGKKALLYPDPLQVADDGTQLASAKRRMVHPASYRSATLAAHVQNNHNSFVTLGLLDKVAVLKWDDKDRARVSPETSIWMDQVFQVIYYYVVLHQLEMCDYPLLLDHIPGLPRASKTHSECSVCSITLAGVAGAPCTVQGCTGSLVVLDVLWVVLLGLHSIIGDRDGKCKVGCLGKHSCFLCMARKGRLGVILDKPDDPRHTLLAEITQAYKDILVEARKVPMDLKVIKKMQAALTDKYGLSKVISPGYRMVQRSTARLPFTLPVLDPSMFVFAFESMFDPLPTFALASLLNKR
jgi:hypothetical protein